MKESHFLPSILKTPTKIVHFAETQRKIITIQYKILLWIFEEYFPHSSLNQGKPATDLQCFHCVLLMWLNREFRELKQTRRRRKRERHLKM